jgi:uncharacterized protein YigA (DUF484 family)
MSNVTTINDFRDAEPTELTDAVVAHYLAQHPDFFKKYPELLSGLKVDHQEKGTVSLVEIQVERLRNRIVELEEEITALMSLAARNDQIFHAFSDIQNQLLRSENFEDVCLVMESKAKDLNLIASIRLIDHPASHRSVSAMSYQRFAKSHLNGKDVYLGRLRQVEREGLFGEMNNEALSPELGSYAILPLGKNSTIGFISFASRDGGHFQPNMDTLFLKQLVSVLNHLLNSWKQSEQPSYVDELTTV